MSLTLIIIFAIYFSNLFFGLSILFKYKTNVANLFYLILLCLILPILTPFIFLLCFFDDHIRLKLLKKRELDEQMIPDCNRFIFTENNSVSYFTDGNQLFNDILDEIKHAKWFIHIDFFTFNTDYLGKRFIALLETKLKEGVEVKIIYDQLGSYKMKRKVFKTYKRLGGEFIPFMKGLYFPFLNVNYRNHRKIIVIDNKISYIGGFNVGDKYLGLNRNMGDWVDSELKITGPATGEIEKRFLADYAFCTKKKLEPNKYFLNYEFTGNNSVQIASSGADIHEVNYIENKLIEYICKAKDYIYIQTPYLILNDGFIRALTYASWRGVRIKIMLPDKKDHPAVLEATKSYACALAAKNIDIYLFRKSAFLHSKVFIADDCFLSVGTTNFDIRSFKYDLEINAFIHNEKTAKEIKAVFTEQLKACTKMPKAKHLKNELAKLFSTIL